MKEIQLINLKKKKQRVSKLTNHVRYFFLSCLQSAVNKISCICYRSKLVLGHSISKVVYFFQIKSIIEGLWAKTHILGFFNLCSKVVDFLHVTQHHCICNHILVFF